MTTYQDAVHQAQKRRQKQVRRGQTAPDHLTGSAASSLDRYAGSMNNTPSHLSGGGDPAAIRTTPNPIGLEASERRAREEAAGGGPSLANLADIFGSPSGGGGRGGGGGGRRGGGGVSGPGMGRIAQLQQDGILQLLQSGLFDPAKIHHSPTDFDNALFSRLRDRIGTAGERDRASADEAYDALVASLASSFENPFTDPTARATAADTTGQAALQAQGIQPVVDERNAQAANEADAQFANLMQTLAANAEAGQQSRLSEAEMARTANERQLEAALLGMMTGVDVNEQQAHQQHRQSEEQRRREVELFNLQQQQAMNQQRLQTILPLIELLASAGAEIPNFSELGVI